MMASVEEANIILFFIILSINHINKQKKIWLLFPLIYKVFLICFNCIRFLKLFHHIYILIFTY
jgi:hypothetical protein